MFRGFIVIVVAVLGAAWFWQDDLWTNGDAQASSVLLERQGAGNSASPAGEARYERQQPSLKQPAAEGVSAAAVLRKARSLAAGGQQGAAMELLRRRLQQPGAPAAVGQLAWELARLTSDGGERRQLIAQALKGGAVSGSDYAVVGELLVVLNRNPRVGLLDAIETQLYEVRPGDSLWKICTKTLKTKDGGRHEPGLLRLMNGMSSDSLQAGQSLLVPEAGVRIEIDREGHGLVAWLEDVPLLAFEVGLGREDRTPAGDFIVQVKQENPTWYRDGRAIPYGDPANILGTRWMGFENQPGSMGYGIHGTELPESVGLDESMGCVRMRNEEVETLFEIVSRGTLVSIP